MALPTFQSPVNATQVAQLLSAAALVLFLCMTYLVVDGEIRANMNAPSAMPSQAPAQESSPAAAPQTEQAVEPEAKPTRPREGTRREWYERRKRRWFTPPETETDRGLPKQRRFRLS